MIKESYNLLGGINREESKNLKWTYSSRTFDEENSDKPKDLLTT